MNTRFLSARALIAAGSLAAFVVVGVVPTIAPQSAEAASCTPGYSPCIPNKASDVDCYGGGGNGPRYTKPGVVYRVTGYDRYRLDSNHDHRGCERN